MSLTQNAKSAAADREEFGDCDDSACDGIGYYLVRDREQGRQVTVCGSCLGSVRGDKR
jgi:hypothetical protein